eukprot:837043-Rhodomonas_salina.2
MPRMRVSVSGQMVGLAAQRSGDRNGLRGQLVLWLLRASHECQCKPKPAALGTVGYVNSSASRPQYIEERRGSRYRGVDCAVGFLLELVEELSALKGLDVAVHNLCYLPGPVTAQKCLGRETYVLGNERIGHMKAISRCVGKKASTETVLTNLARARITGSEGMRGRPEDPGQDNTSVPDRA